MKKVFVGCLVAALATAAMAEKVVIDVKGQEKITVSVSVANQQFARSLKKNLELSGLFQISGSGSIAVSGASGAIKAVGRGKQLTSTTPFSDDASARMAARRLSDAMCETYGTQKGFACDRIAFVSRKGADHTELGMCYPDGGDARQLTSSGKQVVGPRWKDVNTLFYTGILNAGPQIWEYDVNAGRRSLKWSFKGLSTGACVSPDGRRVAIVLSFQGNPELYVIDLATEKWTRLTNTPLASEGQPAWSPDGRQIVYVSDETRHPQLYVIDVATKAKRRLTSKGSQNVDPDWGKDGRIVYITKRGGAQIAVLDPKQGEASAKIVTTAGNWSHPSWSRDNRNVVAARDKALFVVDTKMEGDQPNRPQQVPLAAGNWITPSWSK